MITSSPRPGFMDDRRLLSTNRLSRLQKNARKILNLITRLVAQRRLHQRGNESFASNTDQLVEVVNHVLAEEKRVRLELVDAKLSLNGERIRFDYPGLERVYEFSKVCKERNMGAFEWKRPIKGSDVEEFVELFAPERTDWDSSAVERLGLAISGWQDIVELLEEREADFSRSIDRRIQLQTVFCRLVHYMQVSFQRIRSEEALLEMRRPARLVQELIDLLQGSKEVFLGLTTASVHDDEYWAFHSANITLSALVVGNEIGLSKTQLHELGLAAFLSTVGYAAVPCEILEKPSISQDERRELDKAHVHAAKLLLLARGLDRAHMSRVTAVYEAPIEFALPRTTDGVTEFVPNGDQVGYYAQIIKICTDYDALTSKRPYRDAYGSEVALTLMAYGPELSHGYNQSLLRIFQKAMGIVRTRVMETPQEMRIV